MKQQSKTVVAVGIAVVFCVTGLVLFTQALGSPQAQDHQAGLHQMCGVQDSGLPEVKPEPARSSPPPEGWVDLPHPEELVGPLDEYSETVQPGLVVFYSYPKFYRTSAGELAETVTDLVVSSDPDWDYEVVTGIWTLKVRTDGTFQAIHEGDCFTYRFADLGIGSGDGFRSLQLGSPNWSSYHVVGDTICWNDVFPDLDLKVRYIHDILKVDVIMKEPLIDRIQSQMSVAEVGEDALVTARFEIVEALIFSEARQGQAICDPYNPSLEIDQPLRFVRNGKEVHAIRPAQAFILDEHQAVMDTGTKDIRTAQLWRLSRNGPGVAEMSVYLQDLADAPNGDVLLDPSTTFDPPSRDAFLQEGTSTNWGSATTLSWFYDDRPVLGFDVSSFGSEKVVTSAKLKIYVDLNTNAGDAQARAYNVTTAWDESTVNWYDPWTNDGGDYTTDNQSPVLTIPSEDDVWIEFNVTDAFKARYPSSTSDISSKGYLLRYQSDPGDKIKFCTKEYATVSERPKLEVEYATVSTVVISGGGTDLYSPRSRTITATISPAVSGIPVAFEIIDPDDPADNTTIDASSAGNDNKGAAGSLSPSGSVQTNGSGQAQVTFSTTSMVGGDNYIVRASVSGEAADSSEMIVWRKMYIEYDVMTDAPADDDYGGSLSHIVHDNYLNGSTHGLAAILGALNDGAYQKNRNTYITPVITASSAPPNQGRTDYTKYAVSPGIGAYHTSTQTYGTMNHFISAHLYSSPPDVYAVGGIADDVNFAYAYVFWDYTQYRLPTVDSGSLDNVWIISHEFGHTFQLGHHGQHGQDDVDGLSGHDCLMTQASPDPKLNTNGQSTKRFGPSCVRAIRDVTSRGWLE